MSEYQPIDSKYKTEILSRLRIAIESQKIVPLDDDEIKSIDQIVYTLDRVPLEA